MGNPPRQYRGRGIAGAGGHYRDLPFQPSQTRLHQLNHYQYSHSGKSNQDSHSPGPIDAFAFGRKMRNQ